MSWCAIIHAETCFGTSNRQVSVQLLTHLKFHVNASFNFFMASALTVLEAGLALKMQGSLVNGLMPCFAAVPAFFFKFRNLRVWRCHYGWPRSAQRRTENKLNTFHLLIVMLAEEIQICEHRSVLRICKHKLKSLVNQPVQSENIMRIKYCTANIVPTLRLIFFILSVSMGKGPTKTLIDQNHSKRVQEKWVCPTLNANYQPCML